MNDEQIKCAKGGVNGLSEGSEKTLDAEASTDLQPSKTPMEFQVTGYIGGCQKEGLPLMALSIWPFSFQI